MENCGDAGCVSADTDVNIRLVSQWRQWREIPDSLKTFRGLCGLQQLESHLQARLADRDPLIRTTIPPRILGDDLRKELIVTAAAGITNGIQPASADQIPSRPTRRSTSGRQHQQAVGIVSGSTVDDCTVPTAATVMKPQMETPPVTVSRCSGTGSTNEYVFAYEDVLTSAGNTVATNFTDLPKVFSRRMHKSSGCVHGTPPPMQDRFYTIN